MSFFLSDLASTPSLIVCVCDCSAILFQDMAFFLLLVELPQSSRTVL